MDSSPEINCRSELNVCQCCLSKNCFKNIACEYFWMGHSEVYDQLLKNVFNLSLNNDVFPKFICEDCILQLRQSYHFKNQVLKSQTYLASTLKHEDVSKHDEDDDERCLQSFKSDVSIEDIEIKKEEVSTQQDDMEVNYYTQSHNSVKSVKAVGKSNCFATQSDVLKKRNGTLDKWTKEKNLKLNTVKMLKNSNMCPFKWHKNKYQCFACKLTYTDFIELRKHREEHSWDEIKSVITRFNVVLCHKVEISLLACSICSKPLADLKNLREHLTASHSVSFEAEEDLLIPFRVDGDFACVLCPARFPMFHRLNIHMNVHYQNHICETCGAGFISKSNLREHALRHDAKTYSCDICDLQFTNRYQKEQHNTNTHKSRAKRVCPHCPERFSGHYNRLVHLINVHGLKRPEFKCNSCDRVFLRQYLLNAHVRKLHMKEKNHECRVCGVKFFNKYDLTQHSSSHSGERRHVCSTCSKSYARKATLREHEKSHAVS